MIWMAVGMGVSVAGIARGEHLEKFTMTTSLSSVNTRTISL